LLDGWRGSDCKKLVLIACREEAADCETGQSEITELHMIGQSVSLGLLSPIGLTTFPIPVKEGS